MGVMTNTFPLINERRSEGPEATWRNYLAFSPINRGECQPGWWDVGVYVEEGRLAGRVDREERESSMMKYSVC